MRLQERGARATGYSGVAWPERWLETPVRSSGSASWRARNLVAFHSVTRAAAVRLRADKKAAMATSTATSRVHRPGGGAEVVPCEHFLGPRVSGNVVFAPNGHIKGYCKYPEIGALRRA